MNIFSEAVSVFQGFGIGHAMHTSKKSEDTVTQGQNYVLIMPQQIVQSGIAFNQVENVMSKILELHPVGRMASIPVSILTSAPAQLTLMATVICAAFYRNDQYTEFAESISSKWWVPKICHLNPEVSPLKGRIFKFISSHASDISQVVVTICAIAKYTLGSEKEAITTLFFMGVGYLDRKGLLNQRFSIFFNDNLGVIANISIFIFSSPLQKLIGVINIGLSSGPVLEKISYVIDNVMTKFLNSRDIRYPSFQFLDQKPEEENTNFKFTPDEIINFDENLESRIDPSHVQRKIISIPNNPDAQFETLNTLFDRIGFEDEALSRLVSKIQQDDRFLKVFLTDSIEIQKILANSLTDDGKQTWQKVLEKGKQLNFKIMDPIFKQISLESKNIWEKALFNYAKIQLGLFVKNISGEKSPKGDLTGIIKARESCRTVISFLEDQYKKFEDPAISNDNKRLAKLTIQKHLSILLVEGGDYCVQGIEDAIRESYNRVLEAGGGVATIQGHFDVVAQNARNHLFEEMYARFTNMEGFQLVQKEDRHTFNQVKSIWGQGLGIDLSGAKNDKALEVDNVKSLLLPTLFPIFRIAFWNSDLSRLTLYHKIKEIDVKESIKRCLNEPASDWKVIRTIQKTIKIAPFIINSIGISFFTILSEFNHEINFPYSEKTLIDRAKELIGTNITFAEYTAWWRDYITVLSGNDEQLKKQLEYAILQDPFDGAILLEKIDMQNFQVGKGNDALLTKQRPNEKYLKIMLIEMGFLQKPSSI